MSGAAVTAIVAGFIALLVLWLGRRDLTRPAVAFGVTWFAFAAIAQLRLTELEEPWSTGFTLVVLGGGLAFMTAATLAGGTAPARGRLGIDRDAVRVRQLVWIALALLVAGAVGAAYKASVLDGIPLLSGDPDIVRGRARKGGEVTVPAWSTALTNGFFLCMWLALAAIWLLPRPRRRAAVAGLALLALAGLFGASLEASRNLVVFATAVPLIAAYLLARPRRRLMAAAWVVAGVSLLAAGTAGLYVLRLERSDGIERDYLEREMDRRPAGVRPFLPVYVNAVFPLEAARRVHGAVPQPRPYGLGGDSLTSLPDRFFPEGKSAYGQTVASLMDSGAGERLTWSVASYQGRLLADLGWQGALLGSFLLGLAFGWAYRWARRAAGMVAVVVIAYLAYYSAFMLYDNHLSFSLIGFFDVAVVALVVAYCTGRADEAIAAVRRLVRAAPRG